MFFNDIYKPISPVYNLVLAMLWRHPENIEFDKVKVVHYCANVSIRFVYSHNLKFKKISICFLICKTNEICL